MNLKNQHLSKGRTTKGFYTIILIFCSSLVYSQSAINILDLYHESFAGKTARIITTTAYIGDYAFHSNVGGISFQAVASPSENLKNESVFLDFVDNRLVVQIGTKTFYPDLPFWQLAPIVNFINSSYNVVFSELGDTTNNKEAQCLFHPAFLDNLLGLRLFQADLMNQTDILWDLPIDAQRNYILAPSEQPFTPVRDSTIHRTIYEKLVTGDPFTSYVLTDKDVNFVFDADESGFKLSGIPYYYFVKTELDTANVRRLHEQLLECYDDVDTHAKILLKEKYTADLDPRTHMNDLVKTLSKLKHEEVFNPYSMYSVGKALSMIDSLSNMTDAQIGIQFYAAYDYTESFKPYWNLLKKFNPLVYSAVESTAQWSAFFRYVRKMNPDNWSQFIQKVNTNGKWDAPAVKTPTSYDINYLRYFEEREKNK